MTEPPTVDDVLVVLVAALEDLGIDAAEVTPTARMRADLELDSTELVQVALELTRHFGVKVKLSAKDDLTVSQVCGLPVEAAAAPDSPVEPR
jgi:acyl carrier protein